MKTAPKNRLYGPSGKILFSCKACGNFVQHDRFPYGWKQIQPYVNDKNEWEGPYYLCADCADIHEIIV